MCIAHWSGLCVSRLAVQCIYWLPPLDVELMYVYLLWYAFVCMFVHRGFFYIEGRGRIFPPLRPHPLQICNLVHV